MNHTELMETVKQLITDPMGRIKLDDLVSEKVRSAIAATSAEHFPVQASNIQPEEFGERLEKYETLMRDLIAITILLARWGDQEHLLLLEKIVKRLAESAERESAGVTMWLHLGWYPLHLVMYAAGISAVSSRKYEALRVVLETPVVFRGNTTLVVIPAVMNLLDVATWFSGLPGMERRHTPRSDHLFAFFQPLIEEILFIGAEYESAFNEFEVFLALSCSTATPHRFGPIGRFGWNRRFTDETNALDRLIAAAQKEGDQWQPFKAGLFIGVRAMFSEAATELQDRVNRVGWD